MRGTVTAAWDRLWWLKLINPCRDRTISRMHPRKIMIDYGAKGLNFLLSGRRVKRLMMGERQTKVSLFTIPRGGWSQWQVNRFWVFSSKLELKDLLTLFCRLLRYFPACLPVINTILDRKHGRSVAAVVKFWKFEKFQGWVQPALTCRRHRCKVAPSKAQVNVQTSNTHKNEWSRAL